MYVVYKESEDGPYQWLETLANNPNEIDKLVGMVNWFGSFAATPEAAIDDAKRAGFRFKYIGNLLQVADQTKDFGDLARAASKLH